MMRTKNSIYKKGEPNMKYQKPNAMFLNLSSQDVIAASFNQVTISNGDYSENKDSISFEDLIG